MPRANSKRQVIEFTARGVRTETSSWQRPGSRGQNLAIEDFPSLILTRIGAVAKWKITKHYVEPFGLSLPEWLLVALLARHPAVTHRQIRDRTFMDKGQISTTLRTLIARGLVAAHASGGARVAPRSGSRAEMSLTAKGKALYLRIMPTAQEAQLRVLRFFDADERKQLQALLRRMLAALDGMTVS
jgi:DNA-binding MarR family transcriptional regulator